MVAAFRPDAATVPLLRALDTQVKGRRGVNALASGEGG
jgi:hypothetical protein